MQRDIIFTEKAPKPIGPYSQAVKTEGLLFVSGQIPIDPKTGEVVKSSFSEQCYLVLENLKAILEAGNSSLKQVVKVTIFLTDLNKFGELNDIYSKYFGESKPARATVEVRRLPKDVDIEIEATAFCTEGSWVICSR